MIQAATMTEQVIRDLAGKLYHHAVTKYDPEAAERCILAAIAALQGSAALPSEARPHGDAGDAIDFACDHIEDSSDAMDFLDNWRADFVLHQYPDYERWLATQRRCASEAKAMRAATPTAPVQGDDAEWLRQLDGQFTLETRQRLERIASRLCASLRDRAGRPPDQARSGLGDTATSPSALAREILARSYEKSSFETMPWTIRNAPDHALAEMVKVALNAVEFVLTEIASVDYWEGNCDALIEWRFASAIEAETAGETTQIGSTEGESAVGNAETPNPSPDTGLIEALTAFADEYLPSAIRDTPEWRAVLSAANAAPAQVESGK